MQVSKANTYKILNTTEWDLDFKQSEILRLGMGIGQARPGFDRPEPGL